MLSAFAKKPENFINAKIFILFIITALGVTLFVFFKPPEIHVPIIQEKPYLIQTKRLFIRPLQKTDIDQIELLLADPDTMKFIDAPKNRDEAKLQLEHWMADYKKDGFGFLAFMDSEHKFIGYGGFLRQVVEGQEYIELGYCISKSCWGQGYATEAALALKEYGLNVLKLPRLISIIHENNTASLRVASKIGMDIFKKAEIDGNPCLIYLSENDSQSK